MKYFILMLTLHHALGQCPDFPAEQCGPNEMSCSGGVDPNGCQIPSWCMPIWNDFDDFHEGCPPQGCPVMCDWENEIICPGEWDGHCPPMETCVPKMSPECPAFCPVTCDPYNEEFCPGGMDYSISPNGCETPGRCFQKPRDVNGDFCPFHCPVICNFDETMCPGGVDEIGCRTPDTCEPVNLDCPNSNSCPVLCSPWEVRCPGGVDNEGCPMGDVCMPMLDRMDCPLHCPTHCSDDEIYCPGTMDPNGCYLPDTCHPRSIDANGDFCPGSCPMDCGAGQVLCTGGIDCGGCPIEDTCISQEDVCPPPFTPDDRQC